MCIVYELNVMNYKEMKRILWMIFFFYFFIYGILNIKVYKGLLA